MTAQQVKVGTTGAREQGLQPGTSAPSRQRQQIEGFHQAHFAIPHLDLAKCLQPEGLTMRRYPSNF
jgi:hypothetical protein